MASERKQSEKRDQDLLHTADFRVVKVFVFELKIVHAVFGHDYIRFLSAI